MSEYLCAWIPHFRLQAVAGGLPTAAALALERQGPLEVVAAANAAARIAGVRMAMTLPQARGRCPAVAVWPCRLEAEREWTRRLEDEADRISPRRQRLGSDLVILDFAGLQGLHGCAEAAGERLRAGLAEAGITARIGIGAQPATALMAAKGGLGRLRPGQEAAGLAPLPVEWLADLRELTGQRAGPEEVEALIELLRRWGIATLGGLAGLPESGLASRLGQAGAHLRRLARGEVAGLLDVAASGRECLRGGMEFETPVRDLDRLQAAVAATLAELAGELERRDRLVDQVELRLRGAGAAFYLRLWSVPTREARVLAAQMGLELERRPPAGEVEGFGLELQLAHPRRVQSRLFAAVPPDREKMPGLLARLDELYHDSGHQRVGSPRLLDTHRPQSFAMAGFAPPEAPEAPAADAGPPGRSAEARLALRVFRPPRPLRREHATFLRGAGPWRSSGHWWGEGSAAAWDCDEWDVEMRWPGAAGSGLYRLLHQRAAGEWFVLGRYD